MDRRTDEPYPPRAAVVRETGPSSVMKVENDYPVPKLAPGGVLVKNKYSGINFIDTYHRSGLYKRELPFIGGQEGGGFVAAVTPEAEAQGVKVGDRVAYSSVFQTYAEYTAVPANKVVTVPEEVPLDVAVSCGVQGMTAHYLTHSAHAQLVKPGEWMLIHGTGSGTCQWAAQMAKLRGYKVIGTCSESKQDIARATGVDELIVYKEAPGTSYEDYSTVDLVPKVMEITGGEGVKAVIDGIGLATWYGSAFVSNQIFPSFPSSFLLFSRICPSLHLIYALINLRLQTYVRLRFIACTFAFYVLQHVSHATIHQRPRRCPDCLDHDNQ